MIQRIQTLWLLLAGLFNAGVFYFPLYRGYVNTNGEEILVTLSAEREWLLFITGLIMTVLPLIAIAFFKNRKRQRNTTTLAGVVSVVFIVIAIMMVPPLREKNVGIANDSYWIGLVLPFISIVFMILALMGIRKDQKLVKSLDRLR